MKKRIYYLDNNATTPIDPEVTKAILPFLSDVYFNPSSHYSPATEAKDAMEIARGTIQEFLGAKKNSEIIFTGSASESNNMAIKGVLAANPERKHIITTAVEHPSIYEQCKDLERSGYELTYLPVDTNGQIEIKDLIQAIRGDTAIVSIMHGNNETGVIFPIDKFSKVVKMTDPKIIFHTDATQTVGKLPINLSGDQPGDLPYVDMLSFSGHKIYAPKGIGVLYCKSTASWRPTIIGGHQEKGRRAGTENLPYIVGLAKACSIAYDHMKDGSSSLKDFRDRFEKFVEENISHIIISGKKSERLDSTSNVSFCGIEGESVLYALNEEGICASTGSACSSGSLDSSHVLKAMSIPFEYAHGSIRFSFGRFNNEDDLNKAMGILPGVVARLREISPFWDNEKNEPKLDIL